MGSYLSLFPMAFSPRSAAYSPPVLASRISSTIFVSRVRPNIFNMSSTKERPQFPAFKSDRMIWMDGRWWDDGWCINKSEPKPPRTPHSDCANVFDPNTDLSRPCGGIPFMKADLRGAQVSPEPQEPTNHVFFLNLKILKCFLGMLMVLKQNVSFQWMDIWCYPLSYISKVWCIYSLRSESSKISLARW